MKKLSYILLFLVIGMSLTAQSVWDGKREAIRRGSGTENDPYLIENARQLAWLVYTINWDYAHWTIGKYFQLTTDIDLNGSHDNQWIPIGAGPSATTASKYFKGNFDGDYHKITGFYIDNDNLINDEESLWVSSYAAFFTQLSDNSQVKNLYLEGSITNSKSAAAFTGLGGDFEHCVADVDIESENDLVAGFVASGSSTIQICVNKGNVKGNQCVGGFISNSGNVLNSYNVGKIEGTNIVGGIAARGNYIINCYNVGDIVADEGTTKKGGIVGYAYNSSIISNCHYLESCISEPNEYGEPQTADFMRSQTFVSLLNNDSIVKPWVYDTENVNQGFPVFGDNPFAVDEILSSFSDVVVVYPNPVVDDVYVCGDVVSCEMYDIVGKRVLSVSKNVDKISVTNLQPGIYMMQIFMKNGNVVTNKIVKK